MREGKSKPELLAPAGSIDAGITALDAGADAIYVGLPRFNARERGQNCTLEELGKLIAYAHRHGSKVYVTLNTLIKQSELSEVVELLVELLSVRPDAIIVQDLGVLYLLRTHFPELTVHASTQMGVHNSAGVRMAAEMGISRVILERQVTYDEIDAIRKQTDVELEVFIHGALCCGQSGSCLFSSWMGGWSGNRGRCKQPCRRRYFADEGNGFFFSPKDLYALEDLPRLVDMGISSLKIEGRMRQPDYIHNVVSAYRLMLDAPPEDRAKTLPEAKRILAQALGRKWTKPFRTEADFAETIQHRSMGTSGRLIGTVAQARKNGFSAKLSGNLHLNDSIRVQPPSGDEGPRMVVTRLMVDQQNCRKASAGQTCWIAFDKPVVSGSRIFKTAAHSASLDKRVENLPVQGTAVDLSIAITAEALRVDMPLLAQSWEQPIETQPAQKRPLEAVAVEAEFSRTRTPAFVTGSIRCKVTPGIFFPPSQLKQLRREFWEWFSARVSVEQLRSAYGARLAEVALDILDSPTPLSPGNEETTVLLRDAIPSPIPGAIVAHAVDAITPDTAEAVLPEFCPEAKLPQLRRHVEHAAATGIKRFRVTSLYGIELLRGLENIEIAVSYPLPVCNSAACKALRPYAVTRATAWVVLEAESANDLLNQVGNAGEQLIYARLPLLSTRMEIPATGEIRDARGARFMVEHGEDTTIILPDKAFEVQPTPGSHRFVDLTHAAWGEASTSTFNYPRDWA